MRAKGWLTPILMLTARGRAEDVLRGFEAGADDYLPKPFELSILIARINALLRRHAWHVAARGANHAAAPPPAGARDVFRFADKIVDFDAQELQVGPKTYPADADGSQSAALSGAARGESDVAQEHARRRVESSRGHRYARDRPLHRAAAEVHREGTLAAASPADRQGRRLQVDAPIRSSAA